VSKQLDPCLCQFGNQRSDQRLVVLGHRLGTFHGGRCSRFHGRCRPLLAGRR
jgi:hypothetical protein